MTRNPDRVQRHAGAQAPARWLREAREVISEGTRRRLHAKLGIAVDELESIMNPVRSRLDLTRLFSIEATR